MTVHNFFNRIEDKVRASDMSESYLMKNMGEFMEGPAAAWYFNAYPFESYKRFKKALMKHFLPSNYDHRIRNRIRSTQHNPKIPVQQFINEAIIEYGTMRHPPPIIEQIEEIRANIHYPIYEKLIGSTFKDVKSFMTATKDMEDNLKQCEYVKRKWRKYNVREMEEKNESSSDEKQKESNKPVIEEESSKSSSEDDEKNEEELHAAVLKMKEELKKHENALNKYKEEKKLICWSCDKEGHFHNECRNREKKVFCYKCGKKNIKSED